MASQRGEGGALYGVPNPAEGAFSQMSDGEFLFRGWHGETLEGEGGGADRFVLG